MDVTSRKVVKISVLIVTIKKNRCWSDRKHPALMYSAGGTVTAFVATIWKVNYVFFRI